ncbi:MAG: MoxR family ATPase [Calditrichaceae bacterium]|nr:MoxR family ATPase [Calditrichaceae bacterium]MBN2708696.1 MoxR family ATPase [Calditrichaceae bacterium]RQV92830.1 MAG: MoxR family ATPase [Calditrichota bacterium]
MDENLFEKRTDLTELKNKIDLIRAEIGKVIVGQTEMIDLLIAALLSNGHVLIEGVPGVAKTLTAKLLAKTVSTGFSRIQFTPDLMPSDVLGTSVFNAKTSEFEFKPGPVFSNMILIDEINRSPAKTQSALFEVMEERQVSIDGKTYPMETPFMVIATQNPIEHEGTYRLPEAQIDRFLFKIQVNYPSLEEEIKIIESYHKHEHQLNTGLMESILSAEELFSLQKQISRIHIEPHLVEYIARIIQQTRSHQALYLGGSPRASLAVMMGAKSFAAMSGRDFITPEDIRICCQPALVHRILMTPEKEIEGIKPEKVIEDILAGIEVPR